MGCNTSKDIAVGLVLFNPTKSKRIIMNYLYTKNIMEKQGIPTFTLELVFKDKDICNVPEIAEEKNVFHVYGNSVMFHKERLCRILETKIPTTYTKILFCDADVIFKEKDWYSNLSKLLDKNDIVHPFSEAVWKDLTYTQDLVKRKSSLLDNSPIGSVWDPSYHPGFAWGFKRDWYNRVGFFDWAITGSGDTLSCAAWTFKEFSKNSTSYPRQAMKTKYELYKTLVNSNLPRITHMPGLIEHLWHGSRENRKYASRHNILNEVEDIDDLLILNSYGVFEFKPEILDIWNDPFTKYFEDRNDDQLSNQPSNEPSNQLSTFSEINLTS